MVQVIPRTPSASESLANLLGGGAQGLSQGYAQGMQEKLQQMMDTRKSAAERQRLEGVFEALGLPKEYSGLPEGVTKELLKEKTQENKLQQLMQLLGGGQGGEVAEDINIEGQGPQGISDENILAISALDPNIARLLQGQKESAQKRSEKLEERSFRRNESFLKKIDEQAMSQPQMDLAIGQMEGAIEAGDFGSWRNVVGDLTGFEFLKNSTAQTVNSASKEFLMSALSDLTGRPNMFIEKQITKAIIHPQYTDEANKMIFAGLKHLNDLRKARTAATLQLEEKFTDEGKEIPRNFQKLVQKKMEPLIQNFEEDYRRQLKDLSKKEGSQLKDLSKKEGSLKSVEKGTQLDAKNAHKILQQAGGDKDKARQIAKKLGYEF